MTAKPIVAATDGSEHSLLAVEWAAREALLHGAPLRILSVAAMPPRMLAEPEDLTDIATVASVLRRNRDVALTAAADRAATAAPGVRIETEDLNGQPAQAITDSGSGALMLVVGSRGTGTFAAMLLGSVSRYAASHASCPVVVIRDEPPSPRGLVGVGLSEFDTAAAALTFAFEEAAARKASLTAIHATEAMAEDDGQLAELLADWQRKYPEVPASRKIVHGHPGQVLVELSARADLVVIGRRARRTGLPGPGAARHAVLEHAPGPIAVVPST